MPESMDELIYFTQRKIGDKGYAKVWVYRGACPECGKGQMGKPKDPKTGRAKIRAKEYVCPECKHIVEKVEYEETLEAECAYTCPECGKEGTGAIPFKRKTYQGISSLLFVCEHCSSKIPVTKKMKEKKK
ncbi:hypothetical protein HN587_03160 [Candidatus Woesearchaeota archaeon]|jgi:DNA-directed RNA polymerase subunit RPC12/RpoP|nr:hypothetical protein [Candidatus Woesearchaeota archaeon]